MSTSWTQAIPEIIEEVGRFEPHSILDIGIGIGKFGVLLREVLELPDNLYQKEDWKIRIDGIEALSHYRNPIHDYVYNNVYNGTITSCIEKLPYYDAALLMDVLEFFEKEKGKEIIRNILNHTKKALIISTPLYPDGEYKSRWTQLDFAEFDFDYKLVRISKNGAQIFVILPPLEPNKEFPIDNILIEPEKSDHKKLTIAYFLPHKNLTGGLKMLLEQMKHLRKNGHQIFAFYKSDNEETALPPWITLQVDKEVVVPTGQSFLSYLNDCDVGIAGWLNQMEELSNAKIPIVYWEQGHEYLFGEDLSESVRLSLKHFYQQPVAVTSVSPIISKILSARFGRKSPVIPNGIDTDFYFPGQCPNENIILLVGNPILLFKGFDVALQTLIRVWRSGIKFKVKWVCQVKPSIEQVPFPFPIEYVVMPTQEELAQCYRSADLFLFTSWYEGFGMPPLEAMASGLPVVSTSCGGIDLYAKNKINALLAEPGDIDGLTKGVIYLLNDEKARKELSKRGRETALKFSSATITKTLENYLYNLVSYNEKTLID